jgi:putative DNA primase/helicase
VSALQPVLSTSTFEAVRARIGAAITGTHRIENPEIVSEISTAATRAISAKIAAELTEARIRGDRAVTAKVAVEVCEADTAQALDPFDTLGYIRQLFEPGDWINLQFIHQTETWLDAKGQPHAQTDDNFMFLEDAIKPSNLAFIHDAQEKGWNSYVAMGAFTPEVRRRRKKDIKNIRSAYIELDANGKAGLEKIDEDVKAEIIPAPHFKIESSPEKYHIIWQMKNCSVKEQESLNRALQRHYGSDPASVDASRVLRLPGTRNLKPKYTKGNKPTPVVKIIEQVIGDRYSLEDFKVERVLRTEIYRKDSPDKVESRMSFYEQACEDAGVDAGTPIAKDDGSYNYVVSCPNFEEHTAGVGEFDGSVWIAPSGAISFRCWHSHCDGKNWKEFYRPYLQEQAFENGYKYNLTFGDASEIEEDLAPTTVASKNDATTTASTTTDSDAPLPLGLLQSRPMTDLGNAERLVDSHGDNIRYCDGTGRWFVWEKVKWAGAGKSGPQNFMHEVSRDIYEEAGTLESKEAIKRRAWAKRSESNNAIAGAISLARGLRGIRVSMNKFDADRYVFNMQNGTYNLKTHEFRAHDKQDLITKVSPVVYDQGATCPMWNTFLAKSMPDAETRRFLQQGTGYSLTGDASEDCLFLSIGNGRNGKGVFLNTLKYLMGDYAIQANFDSFTARKGGGGLEVRTDIARMAGARFVTASENDQDSRLAEGLLKTLTGSDTITARKLYQEEEEYLPQFKLWFAVNNEPRIIGVDDGIWSRIHMILWSVFIKPEERILNLRERLCSEEGAGIFNWAIAGLKDYQKNRLVPSQEVLRASKSFRKNSDQIQRFMDERCELGDFQVSSSDLYAVYKRWAEETKEFQVKDRQFKHYMETRGFHMKHTNSGSAWTGIKIKSILVQGGNNVSFHKV